MMTERPQQRPAGQNARCLHQVAAATIWTLACLFALTGCGAAGGLPTVAPTLEIPAASRPALTAAPAIRPTRAATPRPTATPIPSPTPCQFSLQPALTNAWNDEELGCPITPGAAAINTAYAPFEGGQMLWRGDTDTIYVLFNDGTWESHPNEWREGDPEFTCGKEDPQTTPIRGFGRVWCDYPAVREAFGPATAEEIGDSASVIQDFVNGTILVSPFGRPFVLVGEDGVWRRVDD